MDLKNNKITLEEIMKNERAAEVLKREFGSYMKGPMYFTAKKMTLERIMEIGRNIINQDKINEILSKLEEI